MKQIYKVVLTTICFVLYADLAVGDQGADALKSYESGDFIGAIEAYEGMLKQDKLNASILFNIGNSAYRAENLGKAVAALLAARDLSPRDEAIATNLNFVLRKIKLDEYIERPASWHSGFSSLFLKFSDEELRFLSLILWFAGGLLLFFGFIRSKSKAIMPVAILVLLVSASVFIAWKVRFMNQYWAAVCDDGVVGRNSPNVDAEVLESLPAGTPVLISDYRHSWIEASTPVKDKSFWIEGKNLCFYGIK